MDKYTLDTGYTVHVGFEYTLTELSSGLGLPAGTQMRVQDMITRPDGSQTLIFFQCECPDDTEPAWYSPVNPLPMGASTMTHMLTDGVLVE